MGLDASLNMDHDEEAGCPQHFLMSTALGAGKTGWSSCSFRAYWKLRNKLLSTNLLPPLALLTDWPSLGNRKRVTAWRRRPFLRSWPWTGPGCPGRCWTRTPSAASTSASPTSAPAPCAASSTATASATSYGAPRVTTRSPSSSPVPTLTLSVQAPGRVISGPTRPWREATVRRRAGAYEVSLQGLYRNKERKRGAMDREVRSVRGGGTAGGGRGLVGVVGQRRLHGPGLHLRPPSGLPGFRFTLTQHLHNAGGF